MDARGPGTQKQVLLAQACSPGMSCFGHMTVLPSGEVVEAVVETVAAATDATAIVTAADTPKQVEASKTKPDSAGAKAKAEVKAKPVAGKAKPCICLGGAEGPGRFKPYRGKDVWIICEYRCGTKNVFVPFNPGIEEDCWNTSQTYTD